MPLTIRCAGMRVLAAVPAWVVGVVRRDPFAPTRLGVLAVEERPWGVVCRLTVPSRYRCAAVPSRLLPLCRRLQSLVARGGRAFLQTSPSVSRAREIQPS